METTKQIDRGVKVEIQQLSEESHAVVVMECLGTRDKTEREGDATMIHKEEFSDATKVGEGSEKICEIDKNILPELQESLVIVKESERTGKDEQKILHEEESAASPEERMIELEEVNSNEVQTTDVDQIAVEAQEDVAAEEEVLLPDSITPSMKMLLFNIILPTIDIFLDIGLVKTLILNGYLGSGLLVTAGIVTNFLFTDMIFGKKLHNH